jgi:Ala-tRNA(Pro) deacylase
MDDEIAFNAGSHTELVRMSFRDYSQLVQPVVARLSHHALV